MNTKLETSDFNNNKRLDLPCLALAGTKMFAPTADQRFLVGPLEFQKTHFPIQLQYRGTGLSTIITEQDLLDRFLKPDRPIMGNRVFILYGAAGAGKSELVRWLQTQISQDTSHSAVTVRISRTELDLLHIVQRFQQMYNAQSFQSVTVDRWEECRQKPRTLAKILVLKALEQLLRSDDQINALYYQLIDVVQTNLEHCFAAMSRPEEGIGQFIELFSREDLAELLRNSAIPVPIEYETLRHFILKTFRDQLLEGIDLPDTLKQISQHIQKEQGRRPLLLIDDLVQSINLFATDLLDYFITLEEGCWDVVVGITPNSLEATLRGKELLDRITYLDTIDDRVVKLWLSDEYGLSSSFLDETNCAEFARLYLSEYKRQNQQPCNRSCPAFHRCQQIDRDKSEELLAPFNEEVLIRLFRSLPAGKGKVRYFNLYLGEILSRISLGEDLLTVLQQYIKPERAVYHSNKELARAYELYGPFSATNTFQEETHDIAYLHQFFNLGILPEHMQPPIVANLSKNDTHLNEESSSISDLPLSIDPGKEAIKFWLQAEAVNKQLLRNVRRGIVKAIKDGYLLDTLTRLYIAKPTRILRWAQTRYDTIPPIQLEGIDEFDGLFVPRSIGPLAYVIHDFADAVSWQEQSLRGQLLTDEAFPPLLFQGNTYRSHVHNELENQLGMTVEEFAFSLLRVAATLGPSPVELPPAIERKIEVEHPFPIKYPGSIEVERPRLTNGQLTMIKRLFDDCFKLRENIYDGMLLETIAEEMDQERLLERLQNIDHSHIATDFRLNEFPLSSFVNDIQAVIAALIRLRADHRTKAALISICKADLDADETSRQLANFLKFPGNTEELVTDFLNNCRPIDLHKFLILAAKVDVIQYERSLDRLRQVLSDLELESLKENLTTSARQSSNGFTKADAETLASFTQVGFRIPLSQLEMSFIVKIAHHLPDLYKQLELRLQRG